MSVVFPWELNWEGAPDKKPKQPQEEVAPAPAEQVKPWELDWEGAPVLAEAKPNPWDQFETNIQQETISRLIHIESSGKANAQAKTSSARGLTQFTDLTWLSSVERYRPDLAEGLSEQEVLALRDDPVTSIEMAVRLAEENVASLERAGVPITDGAIYLAHFAGISTARKLLKSSDDTPAEAVFSRNAVKANKSILEGKTVGQVKAWAERKMEKAGGKGHVARFLGEGGEDA